MTMLLAFPPADVSGSQDLVSVVDGLLACPSVELAPVAAVDRLRVVLVQAERLKAVIADGVRDLDARELYALDGAGSAGGWLRGQRVGGHQVGVVAARRVAKRPLVLAAMAAGELSGRAAEQVCAALDRLPEQVDEDRLLGVLVDGAGRLLRDAGLGTALDEPAGDQERAAAEVLLGCAEGTGLPPAERLEPVFVLLAGALTPRWVAPSLGALVDALLPEEHLERQEAERAAAEVTLRPVFGGGFDLRGFLDTETGLLLAGELDRRMPDPDPDDPATDTPAQRRVLALRQLARDAAQTTAGTGPSPGANLTIIASEAAVRGEPGAMPGAVTGSHGGPSPRRTVWL